MENETAAANIEQRSIIVHCYQHYINLMCAWSGWDETNFLGRDREIRLMTSWAALVSNFWLTILEMVTIPLLVVVRPGDGV